MAKNKIFSTICIVTICKDNSPDLVRTLLSIGSQIQKPDELIIVDSSLTALNALSDVCVLISELQNVIPRLRYVTAPPHGISAAFNIGVLEAISDYLLFLNSGDEFFSSQSTQILYKSTTSQRDICGFSCISASLKLDTVWVTRPPTRRIGINPLYYKNCFPHPSTLIKRISILQCGLYDESMTQCMDYDLFIRLILGLDCTVAAFPAIISIFYTGGTSSNARSLLAGIAKTWDKYQSTSFYPGIAIRLFLVFRVLAYSAFVALR